MSKLVYCIITFQGCSQDFSKGGGGVAVCQSEGTHQIVMFSPPVVGCLLKKGSQKGGSQAPQDPCKCHLNIKLPKFVFHIALLKCGETTQITVVKETTTSFLGWVIWKSINTNVTLKVI